MTNFLATGVLMALEREQKTYDRELPNLLARGGQYVVIYGDEVLGVWAAYEDALRAGYEKVGPVEPFLVKKIEESEQVHFCTRDLIF